MNQTITRPCSFERADTSSGATTQAHHAPSRSGVASRATSHLVIGDWRRLDVVHATEHFEDFRTKAHGSLRNLVDDVAALRCIDVIPLPFYFDGYMLSIEVETQGREVGAWDMVPGPEQSPIVMGNSLWLHDKNSRDLLLRSEAFCESVLPATLAALYADYLRFHNGVIWGEDGAFRIVERSDDPVFNEPRLRCPGWKPPVKPTLVRLTPDKKWPAEASATVLYGGALFRADFRLHRTGFVEMMGDKALCIDLMKPWATRGPLRQLMPIV